MLHIIGTIIIGLIAGTVTKQLMPGRDPGGFIINALLGIAGAFIATWLGQAIGWYGPNQSAGFIGAVIGSTLALICYRSIIKISTVSRSNHIGKKITPPSNLQADRKSMETPSSVSVAQYQQARDQYIETPNSSLEQMKMTPQAAQIQPLHLFISYAREDNQLRQELEIYLTPLVRRGILEIWSDRAIEAGKEWEQEISHNLETADIILLLISPNFLASKFIYEKELERAMKRHDAGEARVIPIFLRTCDWKEEIFGKLQGVPSDAKPVTRWSDRDEAFTTIARALRRVADTLRKRR